MNTIFKNKWGIAFFAFSLLFLVSCGEEDPTDTTIKADVTAIASTSTASTGDVFSVEVSGLKGDNDMSQFAIKLDGSNLATASFDIIEEETENNPMLLFGSYTSSFTFNINITAPDSEGSYSYDFQITDSEGNVSTQAVDLDVTAPSVPPVLTDESGYTGNTIQQPANTSFAITLTGTMSGMDALSTLTFYADDVALGTDMINYDDDANVYTAASANPLALMAGDQDGFTRKYYIKSHDGGSAKTYKVVLTSASGLSSEITFDIVAGSSLTTDASTVLVYNNSGPNFGGLDLYTGMAVSTSTADYQVKDNGIDGNGNWLKQLTTKAGEGVTFRTLGSMPDGWSFSGVSFKEQVADAWVNGTDVGDTTSSLSNGDIIIANHNGNYFLLWLESVTETTGDNLDYYELSVKG